jgi:large subunit ribosomal protein L29
MATNVVDYSKLNVDELAKTLAEKVAEYQQMKFDHSVSGLANPLVIRAARKEIARINTVITQMKMESFTQDQIDGRSKIRARRRNNK